MPANPKHSREHVQLTTHYSFKIIGAAEMKKRMYMFVFNSAICSAKLSHVNTIVPANPKHSREHVQLTTHYSFKIIESQAIHPEYVTSNLETPLSTAPLMKAYCKNHVDHLHDPFHSIT